MRPKQKTLTLWIVIILIMALAAKLSRQEDVRFSEITFPQFVNSLEKKQVEKVVFVGDNRIEGTFLPSFEINGKNKFYLTGSTGETTFKILEKNGLLPSYREKESPAFFVSLLVNYGPIIILVLVFWFFLRQLQIGGGKALNFGKSKAKMFTPSNKKVTFKDVSGVEEAKEELKEVVDFLKSPKKYTALGGKIPKGVILVGPPGTGKTLLARAVAGEADVPFFSMSGSDFVEMFVGVGASRVRDLFEQGKKNAPCIIFIDEIDAVGRHRGAGLGGGHDEREQTLNQLLVEMDGFESNEGVILIAATNRIDVLDRALLRPGRFDRRVMVSSPDIRGRLGILKVHTVKTPLAKNDVDLEVIARGTPGFTGADLANLVNEAALNAARTNKKSLTMGDFEMAKDKVLMGPERKSMVISEKEKRVTAFHEAGHTLVGINLPHTDPIHKVSIMPRGGALGITQTLPNEDMHNLTREKAENFIAFLMGGRCAEELIFGEITNGASNDIERATHLARNMICLWGMNPKMGPVNYHKTGSNPYGSSGDPSDYSDYSEETAQQIDKEMRSLIQNNYKEAMGILKSNKAALDRLAEGLIIWETLDIKQVKDLIAGKDIGIPLVKNKGGGKGRRAKKKDDSSKKSVEEKKESDIMAESVTA